MKTNSKLKTQNSKVQNLNLGFGHWAFFRGFTLIELMIVITLMAIIGSLSTASYLNFERGARVKNAAQLAKSQVRLAQNYAFSGKVATTCTAILAKTVGWVADFTNTSSSFNVSAVCSNGTLSVAETVKLPRNVTITNIEAPGTIPRAVVFYQPIKNNSSFHTSIPIDSAGAMINVLNQPLITITFTVSSNSYKLEIKPTGEVNEKP